MNALDSGRVNEGGGVVALEGRRVIQGTEADFINAHAGARALLKAGRARREELLHGDGAAVACILDADGDRGYTLVYNPFQDALHVLDGDDALVLQSRFLREEEELPEGGVAAITIESDSGAAAALSAMGLRVVFTPVGDKWILNEAQRWRDRFALGGEESGHTVAPGLLVNAAGEGRRIAVGDGLKSFLNTCAAVRGLLEEVKPEEAYAAIGAPFSRGFKKSYYAYHVERSRFSPGTDAWEAISAKLMTCAKSAFSGVALPRFTPLEDDADVMYLALEDEAGRPLGAVYVRNSGTESRTGVVMRGPLDWEESLCAAGEEVLREILRRMKDGDAPGARAENCVARGFEGSRHGFRGDRRVFGHGRRGQLRRARSPRRHQKRGSARWTGAGGWRVLAHHAIGRVVSGDEKMSETAPEVYFRKLGEFPHAALFEGVTHAWEIVARLMDFVQKLVDEADAASTEAGALRVEEGLVVSEGLFVSGGEA